LAFTLFLGWYRYGIARRLVGRAVLQRTSHKSVCAVAIRSAPFIQYNSSGKLGEWSQQQLEVVLTHERAHRRRDPLIQWLALFNRALFWFIPWPGGSNISCLSWQSKRAMTVLARGLDPDSRIPVGNGAFRDPFWQRLGLVGVKCPAVFFPGASNKYSKSGHAAHIA
jgi:hypothetical protein